MPDFPRLNSFTQTLTVAGSVVSIDEANSSFTVLARSGDTFEALVGPTTYYQVLTNLDQLSCDRVEDPANLPSGTSGVIFNLKKYIVVGRPVFVNGIFQENGGAYCFQARTVYLLHSDPKRYLFEETHWWLTQVTQMADRILDHLFDARRSYTVDDFSKFYRTNLNILGQPIDETVQECAVLSRLLYDLSTAYLITGAERYFMAARAAKDYLREAFRSLSHDGENCFWAYGRRRNQEGEKGESLIIASLGPDDVGCIPLYEQIYALAGLTQYYRITLDAEVLSDIHRTINTFQAFFWDYPTAKEEKGFAGEGGYYSHIDPVTMRPDSPALGQNRAHKNWNSTGDHIPAYLVNLILTLDPLPSGNARPMLEKLLTICIGILEETSSLICEKFPDPESAYVNERFDANWNPDHTYSWQQNRAVCGHNLKIAWNLTRVAHYFQSRAEKLRQSGKAQEAVADDARVKKCLEVATGLADRMGEVGLDEVRGGIFDSVERKPTNGMPIQFAWGEHQGFLAAGAGDPRLPDPVRGGAGQRRSTWTWHGSSAFWNLFFLDRERRGTSSARCRRGARHRGQLRQSRAATRRRLSLLRA